jgi:hypothetical protein
MAQGLSDSVKIIPLSLYGLLVEDAWLKRQNDTLIIELKETIMFLRADKLMLHEDYGKLIGSMVIEKEIFSSKYQAQVQINAELNAYIADLVRQNNRLKKGMKLVKILVPVQIGFFAALLLIN